ncbi:MAG: sensor histidine kinase [Treponema sp.]|nr:sensor histidine kinase [Treponema sp.]
MPEKRGLGFKIVVSVVLYILVIGITGNLFLYLYLSRAVARKAERLDRTYLEAVGRQMDRNFEDLFSLAVICANDPAVTLAVSRGSGGQSSKRDALNAQDRLNAFLSASPAGLYVDRLIVFDSGGLFIQALGRQNVEYCNVDSIKRLPVYADLSASPANWAGGFGPSITPYSSRDSYAFIFRIQGLYSNKTEGFLYLEAGLDMLTGVFEQYHSSGNLSAVTAGMERAILKNEPRLLPLGEADPILRAALRETETGGGNEAAGGLRLKWEKRSYRIDSLSLKNSGLVLYNQADVTNVTPDDMRILYTALLVVVMSLLAAAGLALILSIHLIRPIQRIIFRINKIGANDFSFDAGIEKSRDEIGQIGRAVNKMSRSIKRLLDTTEANYKNLRDTKLDLLQTQINPHFLYNTLDSIQWMAKIQRSPGIAELTRSLINLLRKIAVVPENGFTLGDELALLDDYIAVMSVRFMGTFEVINKIPKKFYHCPIPKLTLQPLIENAIIHGIEPSGRFGAIILDACEEGKSIALTVEDSGSGMESADLETVMNRKRGKSGASLNNIGLRNVDERLKLHYGPAAGIRIESVKDKFTKVTLSIPAGAWGAALLPGAAAGA